MSLGLGQIMGFNHQRVGAPSAEAMLYSPVEDQVLYVARFIASKRAVVAKAVPTMSDFKTMARFYNWPAYAKHFYHERLQRWFREFQHLQQAHRVSAADKRTRAALGITLADIRSFFMAAPLYDQSC